MTLVSTFNRHFAVVENRDESFHKDEPGGVMMVLCFM